MRTPKLSGYKRVLSYLWQYREEIIIPIVAMGGWIIYKYSPYSKLVYDSGLLLNGTQTRARLEIERLRGFGYKLEKDLDKLTGIVNHISRDVITQAIDDVNRSRKTPLDVSKVNFATTLAVHVGTEYHSGSLKNGAFIVLPGTFGMTEKEKNIYKAAKYFNTSSMIFSLLDKNTWKFMVAKELLYLEDERKMMKFSMYLGSLLFAISFTIFGVVRKNLFSQKFQKTEFDRIRANVSHLEVMLRRLKGRQVGLSLLYMFMLLVFSVFIYKVCLYTYSKSRAKKIDKTLASLGPDYIEGGRNYFQKMQDAGFFQHHSLFNKNYNAIGNEQMDRLLFILPKKLSREERFNFYSNLRENDK